MYWVLIVEDNEDNMSLVESYLEDDFNLLKARNGKDGLKMAKAHKPDLVLLDISLPEMDGLEVIGKMREDEDIANIPVIALTAHAMVGDRENFLDKGFDDYVSKPIIDDEKLIETINSLIKGCGYGF